MNGTPELALKLENKSSFRKFNRMAHGLGFKYYIEVIPNYEGDYTRWFVKDYDYFMEICDELNLTHSYKIHRIKTIIDWDLIYEN